MQAVSEAEHRALSQALPIVLLDEEPEARFNQPEIAALLLRARRGMLVQSGWCTNQHGQFEFWQGYAKALRDLAKGVGQQLAQRDAASGVHDLAGNLRAAADCLGEDLYRLTRVQVCERLAAHGIHLTLDSVPDDDVATAQQLEDAAVATVDLHGKKAVADSEDGARCHGGSVSPGGAS